MQSLPNKFQEYLKQKGVCQKTLRNYRSDLNHFLEWSNTDNILPHFNSFLVANYKGHHLENRVPESTTNRRLSTLRNFARFLVAQGYIGSDPTQIVSNVKKDTNWEQKNQKLLEDFKKHLEKEGVSKTTLKNYLSDTRQFLAWHVHETERALDS